MASRTLETPLPVFQHDLPSNCVGRFAVALDGVLSPGECSEWIARAEAADFVTALINVGGGREVQDLDTRSSCRVMFDDIPLAKEIWGRIQHAIPKDIVPGFEPVGLNERLRFLRYDPGQHFSPHQDGSYPRSDGSGERSFLTLLLYLNADYDGGFTTFYSGFKEGDEEVPVVPAPGRLLLHEHRLLHGVPALKTGRKYVVRTDVMFRPHRRRPLSAEYSS